MDRNNRNYDNNNHTSHQSTNDTIMAYVDAVIPRTPILAQIYGEIMYYGALDLSVDEYIVLMLYDNTIPIIQMTAEMLNIAARQYLLEVGTTRTYLRNSIRFNNRSIRRRAQEDFIFRELDRRDRFRAISLLEQINHYFSNELLFQEHPRLLTIASSLNRFTMLGFYSEWYGYGTTRLRDPDQRVFEFAPLSWEQVGYPGHSMSYLKEVKQYYSVRPGGGEMSTDADVIVIGAGGGGAVVAKELGEKGVKVLLLEAGPWYGNKKWPNPNTEPGEKSSSDYDDLSIEVLKKSFTDLEDDMNNYVYGKFRWGPANRTHMPWTRNIAGRGFTWQNSGVGGSTLHYFGNSPRAYPQAIDQVWPISYEELVPYYEKVEAALPVATAMATPKEDLFLFGAQKAGWKQLDSPDVTTPGYRLQPNAILRPNLNATNLGENATNIQAVGCTLRGHCVNGCHIGPTVEGVAKRSTLVSYIPRALSTGNVEVRPNAFVVKVLTQGSQESLQAVGVVYRDTWTGEMNEVSAKVVVMAAGGVETPRLWLNSKLPKNEWVGRGLVNHWFDSVSGIFDEETLLDALGVPEIKPYVGQNAAVRFDYPGLGVVETYGLTPGLQAGMIYGTSNKGYSFLNQPNMQEPWDVEGLVVGEQLKVYMKDYTKTLSLLIFTDDDVNIQNSVTLDPVIKDEHGYIPVINYQPSRADEVKRNNLAVIASEILRKAGAKTIIRSNWPPSIFIHITSTMRLGFVTDLNCEAYQVKRLFIADNSVLYNGLGGPNPTLSTQALATRTAEKIMNLYFS